MTPLPYSVWLDGAAPPLQGDHAPDPSTRDWDVIVVGGGVAGLLCALKASEHGREVCLVEARRVGEGTTAHATVKVTSGHGAVLADIAARHGVATAVAYQRMNDAAFLELAGLVMGLPEPVGWEVTPHVVYASTGDGQRRLQRTERLAVTATSRIRSSEAPAWATGAAWSWEDCALVQPLSLARALGRLLRTRGVPVLEHAAVVDICGGHGLPQVRLADGRDLRCRDVIVATHSPIHDPDLYALLAPVLRHPVVALPIRVDDVPASYDVDGLSTRPVTLPTGEWGAVVVGGQARPGSLEPADWRLLEQWARVGLRAGPSTHRWGAQDVRSPNLLPHVGRAARARHIIVVSGFNAWGFTNAMAAANEAVRLLDVGADDGADLARPAPWDVHHPYALSGLKDTGAALWWAGRSLASDEVSSALPGGTDLQPGEGRVSGGPFSPRAECCTLAGDRHTVSARCTHLGCLVRWNGVEQSWDCPCHGSRFAPDGTVIEGPAMHPLTAVPARVVP